MHDPDTNPLSYFQGCGLLRRSLTADSQRSPQGAVDMCPANIENASV
jgi:hypothetical protein